MISRIIFATQNVATGTSAASTRDAISPATTPGPDCHNSLSTGGILRSAAARSRQVFCAVGFILHAPNAGHPLRSTDYVGSPDTRVRRLTPRRETTNAR